MNELQQLYLDHHGKVSDKWSIYLAEYERQFAPYRNHRLNLLEIGIQNGGSLEIWAKYFGNAANIVGCDIDLRCLDLEYTDPRISVVVGDANLDLIEHRIAEHAADFDIIIDDGSHQSRDIVNSFLRYFPRVRDGGLYVAEDLHSSYWQQFEGGLYHPHSSIAFFKLLADVVNQEHWGVDRSVDDVLRGFYEQFQFRPTSDAFASIHSVEFANSLCIVRKMPAQNNRIGLRMVVGQDAMVATEAFAAAGQSAAQATPQQSENPWSTANPAGLDEWQTHRESLGRLTRQADAYRDQLAERAHQTSVLEEKLMRTETQLWHAMDESSAQRREVIRLGRELAISEGSVALYRQQLSSTLDSTSWRLTAPIRWGKQQLSRTRRLVAHAADIRRQRGVRSLTRSVVGAYRSGGWALLRDKLAQPAPVASTEQSGGYVQWIDSYDRLNDTQRNAVAARIQAFSNAPLISIILPLHGATSEWLPQTIDSVRRQLYPHWQLCIVGSALTPAESRSWLERLALEEPRIRIAFQEDRVTPSLNLNVGLRLATGAWIALLSDGDLLAEHALYCAANAINADSAIRLIYSDEDKIDADNKRHDHYFKPDWNVDLFHSHDLFTRLGLWYKPLVDAVGGFRDGMAGAESYDLTLRCIEQVQADAIYHVRRVLYHARTDPDVATLGADAVYASRQAGMRALEEHFSREKIDCLVTWSGYGYRTHYRLPAVPPLVSLIIPTRNGLEFLRMCITSIFDKTTYANFEIVIVDNGSDDAETLAYLSSLVADHRVRVLRDDGPFNYSALNNKAVNAAQGEIVGLINNDIEVISPDWLAEMVSLAIQPQVGAVGARLLYPNDTLQHGGVVLGIGGMAGHAHKFQPASDDGYGRRSRLIGAYSAVTAACLLVRRATYLELGGLDETNLAVAYNDVDFCLRLREAGYRNVWTPYAEMYHHESATRGYEDDPIKRARAEAERAYMRRRWGDALADDPAYSPNLTVDAEDFDLAWPPRVAALA